MRPALFILPLIALTACATPREQCINDANREVRVLTHLVNETRGNLARGYAIAESTDVRTLVRTCRGRDANDEIFTYPCNETETFTTTRPVSIDLDAEQVKLAQLERRLSQAQVNANTSISQCIAIHPE
ncbi:hypothetical protein DS901_14065 [Loktanella sp. D2R18]|uniref:hypothetical protein n=1 Tax=Rhodobacterales TaxID=204455 RepID=UPI000DE81663|nr:MULTISPECIES: hypothetical protein [Rhodobacterales]MDO6588902.1 hypothetical protein [Yoonia sp. 1_MG-2023]RBW41877.1 hypothetical protein DS901_14065 [Loktanella sp. D2R18]